ncbi:methyl-accepting chemotaxis protein [Salinispira pacifica]|nr:methyl-accepting chemotaxis protein [Salinispira pacifica]
MKLTDKIKHIYDDSSITIQQKAVTLFLICIVIPAMFITMGAIRFSEGSIMVALGEWLIAGLLASGTVLIYRGKFKFVSYMLLITFWIAPIALFVLNFRTPSMQNINAVFQLAAYQLAVLVTTPILAYRNRQVILMLILTFLVNFLLFILYISPTLQAGGNGEHLLQNYVISFALIASASYFSFQVFRNQYNSLRLLEEEADRDTRRYQRINNVLQSTTQAFNVGETLTSTAQQSLDVAQSMSERVEEIQKEISTLSEGMDAGEQRNRQMEDANRTVADNMTRQNHAIDQSSSAIEQISAQIRNMSDNASSKQELMNSLVEMSREGMDQVEETIDDFKEITRSSESIVEVIEVIEGISSRTNLLAMNAAIEAAHAGDAGKGFAVVADEIRKLAEETQENSRVIRETLVGSNEKIAQATEHSTILREAFSRINDSIEDVSQALMELISGMAELSEGTGDINGSIEHLRQSNGLVNRSMETMKREIDANTDQNTQLREMGERIRVAVTELEELASRILDQSSQVTAIGEQNGRNFEQLEKQIEIARKDE